MHTKSFVTWLFLLLVGINLLMSVLSLFNLSIRLDESQQIWMSTKSVIGVLTIISQDVHVPLYALIMHFWIQIWGTNVIAVRLPSLIFFVLTLPVLYKLATEASNSKVGLVTITLFSLSPFVMWYANEARMYTLFTLTSCLANLYFLRIVRSDGKEGKFGYLVSVLLGLYTHYFFTFLLFTQGLYILIAKRQLLGKFILIWIWPILLFIPWLLFVVNMGSVSNMRPEIPQPTSYNILQTFVVFLFGFQTSAAQGLLISMWPLVIILLFLIFTQKKRAQALNTDFFVLATFLPVLLVFGVSLVRPIFLSRYLIFVVPTLFYLIAVNLLNYTERLRIIITTAVIVVMAGLMLYQNFSNQTPVEEDYQGVVQYVEKTATPHDIVTVSAPFTIWPIDYYYNGLTRIETIPVWDRFEQGPIPQFSLADLQQQINEYKKNYDRVFLILSYDQGYQEDIRFYMDNNYELLDIKQFSPTIQLRVYKLRYT